MRLLDIYWYLGICSQILAMIDDVESAGTRWQPERMLIIIIGIVMKWWLNIHYHVNTCCLEKLITKWILFIIDVINSLARLSFTFTIEKLMEMLHVWFIWKSFQSLTTPWMNYWSNHFSFDRFMYEKRFCWPILRGWHSNYDKLLYSIIFYLIYQMK